jgi:hypothetical protein
VFADPNIPETGEQLERSSFGPEDCCFRYCDRAQTADARHGVCAVAACSQQAFSSSSQCSQTNTTCARHQLEPPNSSNKSLKGGGGGGGGQEPSAAVDSAANRGGAFHIHYSWSGAGGAMSADHSQASSRVRPTTRCALARVVARIAAASPYVLLFLLVQKRAAEGYL